MSDWYTVCGTPHSDGLAPPLVAQAALAAAGIAAYATAFTPSEKDLRAERRPRKKHE